MAKEQPRTHWKKLHNPDYLGAWALDPGEDKTVTIDYVRKEQITGVDGKKDECVVVHFKHGIKPMILNATNAKTLQKLFKSPYVEDWAGQPIQLYVEAVKAFGDVVDALRIRSRIPTLQKPELSPGSPNWQAAMVALRDGQTTVEKIRAKYTLSKASERLLLEGSGEHAEE